MVPMWKNRSNLSILENQHPFLTTCIWEVVNVNPTRTKLWYTSAEKCSNHEFVLDQLKILPELEKSHAENVAWSYDMESHAKNALIGIVNWHLKRQSNCTKCQLLAWMTIISSRRKLNQLDNCQKYVLRLSWNVCTWDELVDLQEQSQNGQETCGRRLAPLISYTASYRWSPTVLSRGKHGSALSIGFFPRLRFCWIHWRLLNQHVPTSWMCKKQNVSVPQVHRIGNYFVGCWFANGWNPFSWPMGCGDRSVTFFEE